MGRLHMHVFGSVVLKERDDARNHLASSWCYVYPPKVFATLATLLILRHGHDSKVHMAIAAHEHHI